MNYLSNKFLTKILKKKFNEDLIKIIISYVLFTPLFKNELIDAIKDYMSYSDIIHYKAYNKYGFMGHWNIIYITNMSRLFYFNCELIDYQSYFTKMRCLKKYCERLKELKYWDVSNVINMDSMFEDCEFLDISLNNWNVGNVKSMKHMFSRCYNFNNSINNWDVSNVINMDSMFNFCKKFNQPLNNWNVSNVKMELFLIVVLSLINH